MTTYQKVQSNSLADDALVKNPPPPNPAPLITGVPPCCWPDIYLLYNDSSSKKSSRVTPRTALPSNRSELTTNSFSRE